MKNTKQAWFITGASRGFGLELARQLLSQGHRVAATSRDAAELRRAVGAESDSLLPLAVDLTKEVSVAEAIRATVERFGRIDVVVNNAGYGQLGSLEELSDAEARTNFDVNVFGTLPHLDHYEAYLRSVSGTLAAPLRLSEVSVAGYDVVAIPGGHGPVEDLYKDPDMGRILVAADAAGKIIASVCHGPAALLSASTPDGWWPFAGRRMTAFSDEEEVAFGTADNAPWLLAARLKELGANYERGPKWQAYVVWDGNLISGQNPASTGPLAEAVLGALGISGVRGARGMTGRAQARDETQ